VRFRWVRGAMRRLRIERGEAAPPILLRRATTPPEVTLLLRAGLVALLIGAVFIVFLLDRDGLSDTVDGHVSVSDVFYFTMVTVTTVGYGDIVPVSGAARLIDAFFVTPVRMFIWLIFLGTAYQLVLQRFVEEWRMLRLQRQLEGHVIICGYGHSGSIAAQELLLRGWDAEQVVVIDRDREEVAKAAERGLIGMHGDAASEELLRMAGLGKARSLLISVGRDDTTVLIVLTARSLSKQVRIIASVREPENVKLVRAGGADEVISPPRFGGFLMADAVATHGTVDFVSELLSYRGNYQLVERDVRPGEVGLLAREVPDAVVVEVHREGRRLFCWRDRALRIESGDRVLAIDAAEA
jgi:voltage-gated potassium channel